MSSKITHLKTHDDGWWLNKAVDGEGRPRDLGLGLVTLPAGGVRFVDAKTVARSGGSFKNALAAGLISGPFASQALALAGDQKPVSTPPPPPPAPVPNVEDPPPTPPAPPVDEPVVAAAAAVVVAAEEAPAVADVAAVAEAKVSDEPKKGRGGKR